jgi:hypothetical protein
MHLLCRSTELARRVGLALKKYGRDSEICHVPRMINRGRQFLMNCLDLIWRRGLPIGAIQTEREMYDELAPFADAIAENVDAPAVQFGEAAD